MPFVMSFRMLQKMSCPCLRNYPLYNLSLSQTIWIFILLFLVLTYPDPFYHIFTGFRFTDAASYHCHFYYTCYFYQHAVFTGYHAVKFIFNLFSSIIISVIYCVHIVHFKVSFHQFPGFPIPLLLFSFSTVPGIFIPVSTFPLLWSMIWSMIFSLIFPHISFHLTYIKSLEI